MKISKSHLLIITVIVLSVVIIGFFIPTNITITVDAIPNDPYLRYHALTVDEELKEIFWNSQPEKIIETTGTRLTYSKEVTLSPMFMHYVIYGNSADAGYTWTSTIKVNGKQFTGNVDRRNYIKGTFYSWFGLVF